jgi:hypothetical protein
VVGQHARLLPGQLQGSLRHGVGGDPLGGRQHRQLRLRARGVRREPIQQVSNHLPPAAKEEAEPVLGDEVGSVTPVLDRDRLPDGVHGQPTPGVPLRRSAAKLVDLV